VSDVRRVLVANRGEIAVRIIRACRELGLEAIAVYSDADARAVHVSLANRAVRLGPPLPAESYLSMDAILAAARETEADAIHPGYGFLSENAAFARRCEEAGIIFVGPPAAAIERMGSKIGAREVARRAAVPVVPGYVPADQSDDAIVGAAHVIGFPVLLKPSAGGGGIGMKAVREEAALRPAIAQARREAVAAFGDGTLYVERLVERPRHVEIQVLGDAHGRVVHLFERECSLQRRHQKVVEETPSPALTPLLRARMGEAAVRITREAGYRNAGTIEFLLDGKGDGAQFYFLEMNTRLQVEHPVTEQVTGVDLVRAQLQVAAGEPLPWAQAELGQRGHAIEMRIYAEDPSRGDLPQAGTLLLYREPRGPGIRVDSGVVEGSEIPVHYDPMIAKLIVTGETRQAARQRARAALRDFPILGIRTNVAFLIRLLEHPRFVSGDVDTHFIDLEGEALRVQPAITPSAAAVGRALSGAQHQVAAGGTSRLDAHDPWAALKNVRI
jgi:acetyl-CoA carboxylase biotin carboxylase subunit